jgi:RHH-type proline utilization regulon transcriptional repressor/proline dehydrogenase/delta 1-pyrroline-5-carboxylate dehydrogenase
LNQLSRSAAGSARWRDFTVSNGICATATSDEEELVEEAIQATARDLFARIATHKTSLLSAERWQQAMMDWATADERLKVELFRFVDVFPTLRTRAEIDEHLREYFGQAGLQTPWVLRAGVAAASPRSPLSPLATSVITREMLAFAQRFIIGRDARAAIAPLRRLRARGVGFTLDVLGEASVSASEALAYQRRYIELLEGLTRTADSWPTQPVVDHAAWGELPRVNVSLKITSLFSQIDPLNFRGSVEAVKERLRPVLRTALACRAAVNLDLEQFRYRDLTYAVFTELLAEDEFSTYDQAGVVVQAYLRDAEDDLRGLIDWARERGRTITVRLVKGAYWDYETVLAAQEGWPVPVFTHKPDSDANYEKLTRLMLEHTEQIHPAFATHNVRSLASAIATARALGVPANGYEVQMLHGMGEPIKGAVRSLGLRLREYAPAGELIPGMAYFVRRLLENTANESFLRLTFAAGEQVDKLISAPAASPDFGQSYEHVPRIVPTRVEEPAQFVNMPHLDFARAENRTRFTAALAQLRAGESVVGLGKHWPLWIGGRAVEAGDTLTSTNPARPDEVVGTVAYGGEAEARQARDAALAACPAWRQTAARERAAVLFRAAELMRGELFELAALEVFEAGKTWREADADVDEAIDFLEYYGREMLRLEAETVGEIAAYEPRGVALVVAPWNFPLAILTGMTSAALVAGNAVIVKPAGATPVIAAQLVRLLHAAGAPAGTVNYLPSPGATVADLLVCDPAVDLIAFTGSKEVGLHIIAQAAQHPGRDLKQVVAEMGGKNAIIVDNDADLDVAVTETIISAFHYQGQKCSAASRVIVLAGAYDEFVRRLVEAARSLVVGVPEDVASRMGPVINATAQQTIGRYIEEGKREATLALETRQPAGGWPNDGFFVGPHIFTDVRPDAVIAQEEIFGPVLAVMKARDLDHALTIANGTAYALTGGVISRSPATITRCRRDYRVGNLYINRGITGALVERQAFGGFKMSGVGSKAGGPDYLPQFLRRRADESGDQGAAEGAAAPSASATFAPTDAQAAAAAAAPGTSAAPASAAARRGNSAMAGHAAAAPVGHAAAAPVGHAAAAMTGHDSGIRVTGREIGAAVAAAVAVSPIWRDTSVEQRAQALLRAARLVRAAGDDLVEPLLAESGDATADASRRAAAEVEAAAGRLETIAGLIRQVDRLRRMGDQPGELNHYFYQARGVALVLGSSRHPLVTMCTMAGSALAAGNPVLLKPGSKARRSTARLAGILAAAGLPAGVVSYLPFATEEWGERLVSHRDIALIVFTGTRAAGLKVAAVAGHYTAGDSVKRFIADFDRVSPRLPDAEYLRRFLEPRVITENTLRRGFAPPEWLLQNEVVE